MKFSPRIMKGYLEGPEVEELLYRAGYLAEAIYATVAPRDTGRLASSGAVDVEIARPYTGKARKRLVATVSIDAPYGVPVEFGHRVKSRHGRGSVAHRAMLRKTIKAVRL